MKEDANTKKTLINESPKEQEDPLKSETIFLKQSKVPIFDKDKIEINSPENNQNSTSNNSTDLSLSKFIHC